jgi:hypothetical protein
VIQDRFVRAIFFLLSTAALNLSSAFGQVEPDWKAEIRRAWQARQEAVRTLQMEIHSQKRFVGNTSTSTGSFVGSHRANQLSLSLSDEKFSVRNRHLEVDGQAPAPGARPSESTFDGEKSWFYSGTSQGSGVVGSGAIEDTPYAYGANLA